MKKVDFRSLLLLGALAATLAGGALPGLAQTAGATAGVPVRMIVTVEARHGAQLPVIHREDVLVYEGHDRRPVTGWTAFQGNSAGLELYLLIDDSLSTSFGTRLEELRSFVSELPESTSVGLAYMRNGTVDVVQKPTRDHSTTAKLIRIPQAITGGSPYESLEGLIKQWPLGAERREVLMVTTGIEPFGPAETSNPYVEEAITAAQRAEIPVFTIYAPAAGHWGHTWWRTTWGRNYLSELADETGAEGYGESGLNPVSFTPYLGDLSRRLQNQYELTFLAKPQKSTGLQRVRVMTEIPDADLVAADRVFVPASE